MPLPHFVLDDLKSLFQSNSFRDSVILTVIALDLREECKEWEGRRRELNGILECAF